MHIYIRAHNIHSLIHTVEFKRMPPVLALLSDFNLEVLQHRFSSGLGDKREARGEVQVSAYEFADFTDDYGLVQSLQRLLDPETVKVERSSGTRIELLMRSGAQHLMF